jgi:hypothetical protein
MSSFLDHYKKKEERLTHVVQVKITKRESDDLDELVEYMKSEGANATRSSMVRALLVNGLDVYREEFGGVTPMSTNKNPMVMKKA